jgi:hypothetical protein
MKISLGVLITADGRTRHGDDKMRIFFVAIFVYAVPKNPFKVLFYT